MLQGELPDCAGQLRPPWEGPAEDRRQRGAGTVTSPLPGAMARGAAPSQQLPALAASSLSPAPNPHPSPLALCISFWRTEVCLGLHEDHCPPRPDVEGRHCSRLSGWCRQKAAALTRGFPQPPVEGVGLLRPPCASENHGGKPSADLQPGCCVGGSEGWKLGGNRPRYPTAGWSCPANPGEPRPERAAAQGLQQHSGPAGLGSH